MTPKLNRCDVSLEFNLVQYFFSFSVLQVDKDQLNLTEVSSESRKMGSKSRGNAAINRTQNSERSELIFF